MGQITANPTISLQANIGAPLVYYFADGAALFGCIGSPEGAIAANARSIAITELGAIYVKTTDGVATGWSLVSGGGGSGTVTSVGFAAPTALFTSPVSGSPVTTSGTLTLALETQSANKVFASPSSGAAATPTFRALVAADLALAAAPPSNGLQYNDGTNAFTASNGFKVDPSTNTLQVGELNVLKGTLQLQAGSGGGSWKITTGVPASNFTLILPDAAPANNDLAKFTVSGSNITLGSIAASSLGFPSINATDGVLPYRSSSTAFSDSQLTRGSSTQLNISGNLSLTSSNALLLVDSSGAGSGDIIRWGGATGRGMAAVNNAVGLKNSSNEYFLAAQTATSGRSIGLYSTGQIGFAASAGADSATDNGFARLGVGTIRVTNGSTGAGKFAVGTSVASIANQFLVDSQSTSVIAGFFSMPNGSSVATIQGVTNGIQSFAFNPSGKLQGGCNIPTSNQQFSTIGNLKSDVSELGNSGGTNTNALSFTVPANSIANNGDTVEFITTVVFAGNANNKQVDCQFAGTSVFLITSAAYAGSQGQIRIRIKRTGAITAKVIGTLVMSDVLLKSDCQYTDSLAVTWSSNNTFQVKLQGVANSDIINKELESNVIIAQTS